MRLQPIAAHAALGNQRYAQMDDILHLFHHHLFRPIGFLQRDIETEFVMNLRGFRFFLPALAALFAFASSAARSCRKPA